MPLSLPPFLLPQLVSLNFTDGIFLGLYFVSCAYANRWLIFADEGWKLRKKIHWHILAATNTTLVLVLINKGLTVNQSITEASFVEQGHKLREYKSPPWISIVKCITSGGVVLLADSILMHRLWVTYSRRMIVMWLPIILWLGSVACIAMQVFLQVKHIENPNFGPYQWAKVNMDVGPGIVYLPFLAFNIVLNAYCTGLLVWRIWMSVKDAENSTSSRQLQILFRVLMESGVLYLIMNIAHCFSYFGHSRFAINMIGALHTVVIGIAYDLIIIRVGQNRAEDKSNRTNTKISTFQVADINRGSTNQSTDSMVTGDTSEIRRDKFMAV